MSPRRLPRLIETSAQCIVNDDEIRIAVLMPVESTGHLERLRRVDRVVRVADVEERREERAEEHDLGRERDDQAEHDAVEVTDVPVAGRRAAVAGRLSVCAHQWCAAVTGASSKTTCFAPGWP